MKSIFEFDNYRAYIKAKIKTFSHIRGYQGKLALTIGMQPSYLSKVLKGPEDFSSEQTLALSLHWELTPGESEYFIELVHLERAGTKALKEFFRNRLNSIKEKELNLSTQLNPALLQEEAQTFYFSAWYISAIHLLLGIKTFQNIAEISKRLNLSIETISFVLNKMEGLGLVKRSGDKWTTGPTRIHLSKQSPYSWIHHGNWRHRALTDRVNSQSLHYTALHSVSRKDLEEIRQSFLSLIQESASKVRLSEQETLVAMNIDFFEA
jgi:uncharacterized protein (TIGR02147 family)